MSLVITDLQKSFGEVRALDGISFSVDPGQVFGFLGANGAGKTTAMRIVLDILRADAGTVTWKGRPSTELPRRTFGYLPEERGLYPRMKVLDQLVFFAGLYGVPRKAAEKEVRALAGALPRPRVRRPPRRAALQGQPAEDPVHRRDPPRPRGPDHGRALHAGSTR